MDPSAWAAWAAVACALLVVWLQNRSAKRLACLQLFVQLASQYDSLDMQKSRARLAKALLRKADTLQIEDTVLVFYENISLLHRRGLLDPELLANTFSIDVRSYWPAVKHYVEFVRKRFNDPTCYSEFEKLKDHFARQIASPSQSTFGAAPEFVSEFLHAEALRGGER